MTSNSSLTGIAAVAIAIAVTLASACSPPGPQGQAAAPAVESRAPKETRTGRASFIAEELNGHKTGSGEMYDGRQLVAAHPTYPFGTILRVTNKENGRVVDVKVIDRSAPGARRPIIDLSRAAAERLDFISRGTVTVTTEVLEWGSSRGTR